MTLTSMKRSKILDEIDKIGESQDKKRGDEISRKERWSKQEEDKQYWMRDCGYVIRPTFMVPQPDVDTSSQCSARLPDEEEEEKKEVFKTTVDSSNS